MVAVFYGNWSSTKIPSPAIGIWGFLACKAHLRRLDASFLTVFIVKIDLFLCFPGTKFKRGEMLTPSSPTRHIRLPSHLPAHYIKAWALVILFRTQCDLPGLIRRAHRPGLVGRRFGGTSGLKQSWGEVCAIFLSLALFWDPPTPLSHGLILDFIKVSHYS